MEEESEDKMAGGSGNTHTQRRRQQKQQQQRYTRQELQRCRRHRPFRVFRLSCVEHQRAVGGCWLEATLQQKDGISVATGSAEYRVAMNVADDDTAASNLQQNLLKEAYSAAAGNLAALQHTLDSMGKRACPSHNNTTICR